MSDFLPWKHAYVAHVVKAVGGKQKRMTWSKRIGESQMVANYVMLGVKVRTKDLITAWEMKCSPERNREFLCAVATTLLSHKRVQGSGIIGNSLKGLSDNTKSVMFEHSNTRGHERCIARKSWSGWEPLVQPQEPGVFFFSFFFLANRDQLL